jgi:RNA polymerase sigma-70 factor (ECF subfamily)
MYKDYLFNACWRLLRSKEDSEDAVHEAFIKGFQRITQLKEDSNLGGWLKRIAVNHCIDVIRKRKRNYLENVDDLDIQEVTDEIDEIDEIPVNFIKECLNKMDDKYRVVLILYLIEDYSHREISAQLNLKESTVRNQYVRGKQRLLKLIKLNYNDEIEALYSAKS